MRYLLRFIFLLMVLLALACTSGKRLPEGQVLYRGAKVKVIPDNKHWDLGNLKSDVKSVVSVPVPNKSFLGISPGLWIHLHTKENSWIQRKMGKKPVLLKSDLTKTTEALLANRAANNGFFNIEVVSKRLDKPSKRTAKMRYEVYVKAPATLIDTVAFPNSAGALEAGIRNTKSESLLKVGEPYNLEKIKQERQRIANALLKDGFYYFKADHLLVQADTLAAGGKVRFNLVVKPSVPERPRTPQFINHIHFLAKSDTLNFVRRDTTILLECITFGPLRGHTIPNDLLRKTMLMRCARKYNSDEHDATLAYLSHLGAYKFINVGFDPSPDSDSLMDVRVMLTPFSRNKAKISLSAVFAPNLYWGSEFKATVDRRNAFGRGELLRWVVSGEALRLPRQDEESYDVNLFPIETNLTLWIPRFRPPRVRRGKYFAPLVQTKFMIGYELNRYVILPRELIETKLGITLHEFNFEGGLVLKNSRRPTVTHEINFVQIGARFTTIHPPSFRDAFEMQIQSDTNQQFINFAPEIFLGPNYSLIIDNRFQLARRSNVYYRGFAQLRGGGFMASELTSPALPRFNLVSFIENDFRYFYKLTNKTSLAFKALVNAGLPISSGSSNTFNINDLYIVGGANSVRAFAPRYFGPGILPPNASNDDLLIVSDHAGNILLESSFEHRYRILPRWEVASFLDFGNTWVLNEVQDYPGGVFKFNRFYKEFAVGAGVGLRFVFSYLVVRLDLAMPLHKPWLAEGNRWVFDEISLGSKNWRKENLLLNFAVGYPF